MRSLVKLEHFLFISVNTKSINWGGEVECHLGSHNWGRAGKNVNYSGIFQSTLAVLRVRSFWIVDAIYSVSGTIPRLRRRPSSKIFKIRNKKWFFSFWRLVWIIYNRKFNSDDHCISWKIHEIIVLGRCLGTFVARLSRRLIFFQLGLLLSRGMMPGTA